MDAQLLAQALQAARNGTLHPSHPLARLLAQHARTHGQDAARDGDNMLSFVDANLLRALTSGGGQGGIPVPAPTQAPADYGQAQLPLLLMGGNNPH